MKRAADSHFNVFLSLVTVLSVIFLDRITKVFFSRVLDVGESIPVLGSMLTMTLVHNTGIAFGLFRDQGIVFIIVPISAILLLIYNIFYYHHNREELSSAYIVAFSMILGGAIGNLIDRIVFGYVIDFIDFQIWPVFNIADSSITVGAVIIAFMCIPKKNRK